MADAADYLIVQVRRAKSFGCHIYDDLITEWYNLRPDPPINEAIT